ncbi:hypothetical protein BJ742DRAFT_668508, partial [Cladochytrium replicatum]
GLPLSRGLLILAKMSSSGKLPRDSYTVEAVRIASKHRDFVFGYIGMRIMPSLGSRAALVEDKDEDYITLTPGVSLEASGDALGKVNMTQEQVILESGFWRAACDVIIVGKDVDG